MKYLNLLELILNCLKTAADLWDWLQQNNFFFETFGLFLSWNGTVPVRMNSYSPAQKSSGAIFRDTGGERWRKRLARLKMSLRGSQGVRPRGVMVNRAHFLPRQLRHQLWVRSFPLSSLKPNCFSISSRVTAVFPHKGHVCCSIGILREGSCRLISLSIKGVRS